MRDAGNVGANNTRNRGRSCSGSGIRDSSGMIVTTRDGERDACCKSAIVIENQIARSPDGSRHCQNFRSECVGQCCTTAINIKIVNRQGGGCAVLCHSRNIRANRCDRCRTRTRSAIGDGASIVGHRNSNGSRAIGIQSEVTCIGKPSCAGQRRGGCRLIPDDIHRASETSGTSGAVTDRERSAAACNCSAVVQQTERLTISVQVKSAGGPRGQRVAGIDAGSCA